MGLAQEPGQVYRYDLEGIKFVVESFEIRQVMTIIPKKIMHAKQKVTASVNTKLKNVDILKYLFEILPTSSQTPTT